ncbi:MAG: multi-Cu oxidase [Pseudomonadota bacterium]
MVPTCLRAASWRLPPLAGALFAASMSMASPPAARPDPLDPAAAVPPATYASSLRPLRRAADAKPVPWREANDTVTRIGGWRAYAREPLPGAAASSPAAGPAPAGHAGHRAP